MNATGSPGRRTPRIPSAAVAALGFALSLPFLSCASIDISATAGGEAACTDLLRLVDDRVRALMSRQHVPGLSAAIVDDQTTLVLRGYGLADRELRVPATAETVFRAYSITKVFTALEIMRLVDEGEIRLDEPLEAALPEWREPRRREPSAPVTVRHLLAHRAGLPRNASYHGSLAEIRVEALRAQVASLAEAWAAWPAGTRYKYSNVGFNVLGRIVETRRDEPFATYMDERVLPALGMRNSAFLLSAIPRTATIATGYEFWRSRYRRRPPGDIIELASGNLFTSAADLAAFMKRLLAAGETPDAALPRPETLREMGRPQFPTAADPQRNGLGWMTSRDALAEPMVWHQGGDADANATIAVLPGSKLGVALLSNAGSYDGSALLELAVDLLRAMLRQEGGAPIGDPSADEPTRGPAAAADPASCQGRYIAFGEAMEVTISGGHLRARLGPATLRLDPAGATGSGTVFAPRHWLETLGFGRLFPVDLDRVRITFPPGDAAGLFVSVLDLSYEFCPRYPSPAQPPESWLALQGTYDGCEIVIENGMLRMSGVGYLVEREPGTFVVLGGPYAGETVTCDSARRTVHHQGITYPRAVPRNP